MLARLIYASEPATALDAQQVSALLREARRNNGLRDITGMLVFDSQHFLQALEGDRRQLSELYGRLAQDRRHHRLVLLGHETITARQFGRWQMGFAPADAARRALYLQHSCSGRFEPHQMTARGALDLLVEMARGLEVGAAVH